MEQSYLQVGVKILLKNKEGRYLLIRRNPKKYPEVGPKWDIIGGRIDIGSSLMDNLAREVKEEVGLTVSGQPVLVGAQDILKIDGYPGRHVVRLTYIGNVVEGEDVKIDEESLEYRWFTGEEIESLGSEDLCEYVRELLDNQVLRLNI